MLEDDRLIEVSPNGRHRLGVGGERPHRRVRLRRRTRERRSRPRAGFNKARGQLRLAARQLGDLCRAEPLVRRGRQALRAEQRHHQQPRSQPARHRRPRRVRSSGGSVPTSAQSKELRAIRQIIGQHHAHLIPKGLPGAGNLLVFDNGGSSGYGFASPIAPDGGGAFARATSRVLEINPVTLELVWSYTNPQVLQHQHQRRAAAAERQHADHRRRRRPDVRGHAEKARSSGNTCFRCSAAPTRIRRTPCTGRIASRTAGFRSSRARASSASPRRPRRVQGALERVAKTGD